MRQKATIAVLLAGALAFPAMADEALAPGKPAGAKAAQISQQELLFVAAGLVVIGVGLYLAAGTYTPPAQPSGGGSSGNMPTTGTQ